MIKIFRGILFSLALCVPVQLSIAGAASAQENTESTTPISVEWSPFMTPETLNVFKMISPQTQIIDIRAEKYVKNGTIPGAVWIPFPQWRQPSDRPGQPLIEEDMAKLLGDAGIRLDRPIVVYNHSGRTVQTGRSAIAYWVLKTAGAEQLAILNGGFKAWRADGLPEAATPATMPSVTLSIEYDHQHWADPVDIFAVTTGQKKGAILDARLDAQVRKSMETGKPMMSMPLAQYIPSSFFTNYLSAKNMSAPAQQEFLADLKERGVDVNGGMLISVCQTGELSALAWFYASEIIGIENVRYYPDALRGWQNDGGRMFGMKAVL